MIKAHAQLEVLDEVNVKLKFIDEKTMKQCEHMLAFYAPNYRWSPKFKIGHWDGKIRLLDHRGNTQLNYLPTILPLIESRYELEIIDHRGDISELLAKIEPLTVDMFSSFVWPEGHDKAGEPIVLRDYQIEAGNSLIEAGAGVAELGTSAGKAQPLYSKILTPDGWKTMGDMAIGSEVIASDGTVSKVLGVYPQGSQDVYRIWFEDGRYAESTQDHLWSVFNKHWKPKTMTTRVMPLFEIQRHLELHKRSPLFVDLYTPYDGVDRQYRVHPYVVGVLLGDGSTRSHVGFTSFDSEIVERVRSLLPDDCRLGDSSRDGYCSIVGIQNGRKESTRQTILQWVMDSGLHGKYAYEKVIPDEYLEGSLEQRIELIKGLLDTNGYVDGKGSVSFCTTSPDMADQFVYLIRSIGGYASIRNKQSFYRNKDGTRIEGKPAYTIHVYHRDLKSLVGLARKRNRVVNRGEHIRSRRLRIVKIEKVDNTECQCIRIDHPMHLYVTDNFVVTHNSLLCAALAQRYSVLGNVVVVVPTIDLVIQTRKTFRMVGIDCGIWYGGEKDRKTVTMSTWQSLDGYDELFDGTNMFIIDECHNAKSKVLSEILSGPGAKVPFRFGCTGTLPEEDLARFQIVGGIGPSRYKKTIRELQEQGYLAEGMIQQIELDDKANANYPRRQEYNDKGKLSLVWGHTEYLDEIKWMHSDPNRMEWVCAFIRSLWEDGKTLVLVQHHDYHEKLVAAFPEAIAVTGKIPVPKREPYWDRFRGSENLAIVTAGVGSTGIDVPEIRYVVGIEMGKSMIKTLQTLGRGLRKTSTKTFLDLFDLHGNAKFSHRHANDRKALFEKASQKVSRTLVSYL